MRLSNYRISILRWTIPLTWQQATKWLEQKQQTQYCAAVLSRIPTAGPYNTLTAAHWAPLDSKPAEIFSAMEIACHIQLHPDKKSWRDGAAAQRCPVQRHSAPPCKKLLMTTTRDFTEIEYEMI